MGRELQIATRPFVERSRRASWWYVGSTLALLIGTLAVAGLANLWPIRLTSSVLGGLIMARAFILYHDFMHGSLLRGSLPALHPRDIQACLRANLWDEKNSRMVSYREAEKFNPSLVPLHQSHSIKIDQLSGPTRQH